MLKNFRLIKMFINHLDFFKGYFPSPMELSITGKFYENAWSILFSLLDNLRSVIPVMRAGPLWFNTWVGQ